MPEVAMLCKKGEWGRFPEGYVYEPKLDGTRCVAVKRGSQVKLINRRGDDYTERFPELVAEISQLEGDLTLDGEITSRDFSTLAGRAHLQDTFRIELLSKLQPCDYCVFDLLEVDGKDLTSLPLRQRKLQLRLRVSDNERLHLVLPQPLDVLLREVEAKRIEGVVAKHPESPYEFRRSPYWIKFRKEENEDLPIIGYEDTDKPHRPYRSLILRRGEREVQASSGLSEADLRLTAEMFKGKVVRRVGTKNYFAEPVGYAEVRFYGGSGIPVRFPRVVRLRFDK